MARVPSGTTFWVAGLMSADKPIEAISNAAEAVVTSAAHGLANGDVVFISGSGWGRLNKRAFRIKGVTANTFILELCDTTNVDFYPNGTGVGTFKKASNFTQIVQALATNASGGAPKPVNFKYLENDVEMTINDGFGAVSRTVDVDADSISTPGYALCRTLTETQQETVMRQMSKSGAKTYLPCTVALMEEEQIQDGQIVKNQVVFSGTNRSTRYPN